MCSNRKILVHLAVVAAAFLLAQSSSMAATLIGGFTRIATGSNVNLTAAGPLDWIHWGLHTDTSVDRKAGVTPQISDFQVIGYSNSFLAAYQYSDNYNGYSWSDGTPNSSVTNTTTGVWAYGFPPLDSGFELTVPANTTLKTLKVFVGAYAGQGRFEASLSGTNYVDNSLSNLRNGPGYAYIIQFAADSPGEKLTIRYTLERMNGSPSANVTLQAATLTSSGANNPPVVSITSPVLNAKYTTPTNIVLSANAYDFDGAVMNVEFFDNGEKIGEDALSPYSINWSPPAGFHVLTAIATDNAGQSASSAAVEIFVNGSGGALAGSRSNSPTRVNLTAEGILDWTHWGLTAPSDFAHKAGVSQQISNVILIGSAPLQQYSNNMTLFSWSDGTPVAVATDTPTGIFITGAGNGYQLIAPADLTPRRLKVYAGLYGARGNFQAYLSDFSAPAYTDTVVSNIFGDSYVVFTIDYAAASAGQQLIIRYRSLELYDFDYGNVTLQSATLSSTNMVTAPIWILNPQRSGNDFSFSFDTQSGKAYRGQYTFSLVPTDWQTFTNVSGTGDRVTVTNRVTGAGCFYRVAQP